ncbi:MAG: ribosome small subunit-dependent GTPase A [Flavobacteriales bacterium]|nr:ribosome small subunit-dependent GTPase A [Flavobacteriales bacterium]
MIRGVVAKSTGHWYDVWLENGKTCQCRLRGKLRLTNHKLTNYLAVGDVVWVENWDTESAAICKLEPRKNYLIRRATKLSSQFHLVAANINQAIIMATYLQPRTSTGFIDRFLVACQSYGIEPIICFNKMDLITQADRPDFQAISEVYITAGYRVLFTSLKNGTNLDEVETILLNRTTLIFGHSGTGKSTLLNLMIPGVFQQIKDISATHNKGTHTTTFAQMFKMNDSTFMIDTPGVKEFGMEKMEEWKLAHYFREFEPYISLCRYNTCTHIHEPGCEIQKALARMDISDFRYKNYLNMIIDINDQTSRF